MFIKYRQHRNAAIHVFHTSQIESVGRSILNHASIASLTTGWVISPGVKIYSTSRDIDPYFSLLIVLDNFKY